MSSFSSAGSTWSNRPSRTCWSTRSRCKCLVCIGHSDHSVPRLLYLYHLTLVSSDCDLFRAQMVSLVPEVSRVCLARREMKDQEDSLDLRAQLGCRCGLQWKIQTQIVKYYWLRNTKTTWLTTLHTPQGLPGPPGEKGETGDVGQMVRALMRIQI